MRKIIIALITILVIATTFYFIIFHWFVPKTALMGVPFKWRNIPVQQSKNIARGYFGQSIMNDSTTNTGKEIWSQGAKGKMYLLELDYTDTVVTGYSIRYTFNNAFISKNYLLDTFSIK